MSVSRATLVAAAVTLSLVLPPGASAQTIRQLFLAVRDSADNPVLDLGPDDFRVDEGGAAREVVRAGLATDPMRIVLLVDNGDRTTELITQIREGLHAFLDNLPPEHEVVLVTTGRQLRVRSAPTTDRARLRREVDNIFPDKGAGTVLLDSLRETWDRFLKKADDRWPVYVIVTTDGTEGSSATQQQQWDRYLDEILQAGVSTHAVVLQTRMGDLTTQIAMSLTTNTGGQYEAIAATTGLAAKLTDIAARLARDSEALKSWYLVRYESHSKDGDADVGIGVARSNVHLLMSGDRRVD